MPAAAWFKQPVFPSTARASLATTSRTAETSRQLSSSTGVCHSFRGMTHVIMTIVVTYTIADNTSIFLGDSFFNCKIKINIKKSMKDRQIYTCTRILTCKKVKASSYIAQYPVLRNSQSAFTLYFPDRPVHSDTISASSHMLQLMREGCSYTYPPLSIARYSFWFSWVNWSNVEWKTCPRF